MIDLVPYEAFTSELQGGIRRRTLERMSAKGTFPPMVRWSPYSPPLWSLTAVRKWIAEKLAPLDVTA
jgi:predicted DNA-binding transcriptional regulator AlpA